MTTKTKIRWILRVTYNWTGKEDQINREYWFHSRSMAESTLKGMYEFPYVECATLTQER